MKTINNFILEKLTLNSFMTNEKLTLYHHVDEKLTLNNQTKLLTKNWSIKDAQDGDIITDVKKSDNSKAIYIFKNITYMSKQKNIIMGYCYYDFDKKIFRQLNNNRGWIQLDGYDKQFDYWLSTKDEKREFFNAMKNEGYTWDPNKKELTKI